MSGKLISASVIIPTYNRSESLAQALASLSALKVPEGKFEVIVVDNNSLDDTRQVAEAARSAGLDLKYVFEPRLSFTLARHTGADAASGEILIYIDDDVTVTPGWLTAILDAFETDGRIGVLGGPILPIFETEPPDWVCNTPGLFNGLSLWTKQPRRQEVKGVPGPNFSVRRSFLHQVGGFPADTIGVEANGRPGVVEKVYVGDGDYGLCRKIHQAGYKVIYEPGAIVEHHIPELRLTKPWWRARLAGEAYVHAIVDWREQSHFLPLIFARLLFFGLLRGGKIALRVILNTIRGKHWLEMLDFQWVYVKTRLRVQWALIRHPKLADQLWEIALTGIQSVDLDELKEILP
ncbi:MAG: glycosyltransferase family 2 protein [Anaerolineales bacterium]|nr:glycosyltransferase family 2 protein [Chloroflexota bacterium]MBL6982429.1 glycosyltransferase family 2 protein [Anaerolineales bacterium]